MCDISKLLCNFAQINEEIEMRKHFIYTLWGIFATFVVSAMLAFFAIWNGWIGYMPDIEDLQKIGRAHV